MFKGKEPKKPPRPCSMAHSSSLRTAAGNASPSGAQPGYFGGDKAKGQEIFDLVTGGKKVEDSDWFRVGRVYAEAGEWGKAQAAFDQALAMNADDDSGMIEYGALANVNNDRARPRHSSKGQ